MTEPGSGTPKPPDIRSQTWSADLLAWLTWEEAPPPGFFREAVEAVIADFPIEPTSVVYGVRADATLVVTYDRGGWHFTDDGSRGAALRVAFAFRLQDQDFDGQGSEPYGRAWPECPGHAHPPEPQVIGGEAFWVCPREQRRLAPIGRLVNS